jgi:hypothetical protein
VKKTLVVFTYAPAGLGHIRVANALMESLKDAPYCIFSPLDKTTEAMHRFSSINTFARKIMEFTQSGFAGYLYTKIYTNYLKTHTDDLLSQFIRVVISQKYKPDKIIIVSTHFGLAYQLGELKDKISRSLGAKVHLVVTITDDSPQDIWYVDTADILISPSQNTRRALIDLAKRDKLPSVPISVVPYPVPAKFATALNENKNNQRIAQLNPKSETEINIIIPVSGAAVGMEFFSHIVQVLHQKSPRFVFHIVCRQAPFTKVFLKKMAKRSYVKIHTSKGYREIVDMYEKVYEENIICAEITKPSEQCFKALLNAKSVGGSFLFLAEPVGRQERDNINFLKRHGFIETNTAHTRGFILPHGSKASADLIWDLFNLGKLQQIYDSFKPLEKSAEIGDDGAKRFWEVVFKQFAV